MARFNALVLAGSRDGKVDPVAKYAGVPHKALIELEGRPLLARVVQALRDAGAARIGVSANAPPVRTLAAKLGCEVLETGPGPSQSARIGVEAMGAPLVVTTADHALLRPEWVTRFLADAPSGADVSVLAGERAVVQAAAPGTRRTYLKFADGDWSGCNLFYFATPRALGAVDLWRRVEAERKRPWKIAAMLGPGVLASYALGRLTIGRACARLGALAGVEAAVVATPYGLAAVDVDKPADLDLVRALVKVAPPQGELSWRD